MARRLKNPTCTRGTGNVGCLTMGEHLPSSHYLPALNHHVYCHLPHHQHSHQLHLPHVTTFAIPTSHTHHPIHHLHHPHTTYSAIIITFTACRLHNSNSYFYLPHVTWTACVTISILLTLPGLPSSPFPPFSRHLESLRHHCRPTHVTWTAFVTISILLTSPGHPSSPLPPFSCHLHGPNPRFSPHDPPSVRRRGRMIWLQDSS